ncbi:MAG TPA: phosphatase PAP2 family protein [Candidatus Limnocylindrales bacterium]|nr:phosphatase PAP2 family protein [Candidatus Limnocylindrales bacterium]
MRTRRESAFYERPYAPTEWNRAAEQPERSRGAASSWLEETRRACGAFEWVTFSYLGWLLAVFTICHRNLAQAKLDIALHLTVALMILSVARAAARSTNGLLQFARHWYPLPLYLWLFEELGGIVHTIFPVWFDRFLIEFDYNLAGVHPSVWLARLANPALNDFMQFAYMSYFLYLVILPAILYSQRERIAFWTVMTSTAIAHYSVYVIALLFPVESPYYSLASLHIKELTGGGITATMNFIERFGRVHGAAFPSAHVAGSMVAILASWRYRRGLFWICLPFFVCMCVATVYGRYHYVADVLAGLAVGTAGFLAGTRLMASTGAAPKIAEDGKSG